MWMKNCFILFFFLSEDQQSEIIHRKYEQAAWIKRCLFYFLYTDRELLDIRAVSWETSQTVP